MAAVAACTLALSGPASAEPSGHASCLGIEASAVSPPGSSDEFAGGMPELVRFVHDQLGQLGPVASQVARIHAGSHEACDEATE
jgi:hypothetical protein